VYSFQNDGVDARYPIGGLIGVKGTLYGTTSAGGVNCARDAGCGAVFAVDPNTGAEKVLYSFCNQQNCSDGVDPLAGLIEVKGILYGTTVAGGIGSCYGTYSGCGTVFSLDPNTGVETVVYSFCKQQSCVDGEGPEGNLIEVKSTLYGTTGGGGTAGYGTVFSVNPQTGAEAVVYSFCSQQNCADGESPIAGLINVNGVLYGTAEFGGNENCLFSCGVVFSLRSNTGAEKTIYSFCSLSNCTDGEHPRASLIDVNGTLYGTTEDGGSGANCTKKDEHCGTVFALSEP
jgi:uncharacterized repeat protein (TIGR03803 family)